MDKIQEINEFIRLNNIKTKLISTEYKGWRNKMDFQCSCGNSFKRTWGHFKRGQYLCLDCSGRRKITLKLISDFLKMSGSETIVIDNTEPQNRSSKIKLKCGKCGQEFYKSWDCMQTGNLVCKDCSYKIGGQKQRIGLEKAKNLFFKAGYELLEQEYIDNSVPMLCKCSNGHIVKISYNNFLQGKRCKCCHYEQMSKDRALKLETVISKIHNNGFTFVGSEQPFKNAESYVEYYCPNNHLVKTKAKYVMRQDKIPCKECFIESVSGENSIWWNESLSDEERAKRRDKDESKHFRKQVFIRDNFTCIKCGVEGGRLNAHHINSYNWDIENRANIDNGVTLCECCHREFHSRYGFGDNTKEQFEDWIGD